jgi:hypothetical protein
MQEYQGYHNGRFGRWVRESHFGLNRQVFKPDGEVLWADTPQATFVARLAILAGLIFFLVALVFHNYTVGRMKEDSAYRALAKVQAERLISWTACQELAGRSYYLPHVIEHYNSIRSKYNASGVDQVPEFPHLVRPTTLSSYMEPAWRQCKANGWV